MAELLSQGAGAVLAFGGIAFIFMAALGGWGERHIAAQWRIALAILGSILILLMLFVVYSIVFPPSQETTTLSIYIVVLMIGIICVLFALLDWVKFSFTPSLFKFVIFIIGLFLYIESYQVIFQRRTEPITTSQHIRIALEDYFDYLDKYNYDLAWDLVKDSKWVEEEFKGNRSNWQDYFLSYKWSYNADFYRTIVPFEENKAFAKMDISVLNRETFEEEINHEGAFVCLIYDTAREKRLINRFNFNGVRCEASDEGE